MQPWGFFYVHLFILPNGRNFHTTKVPKVDQNTKLLLPYQGGGQKVVQKTKPKTPQKEGVKNGGFAPLKPPKVYPPRPSLYPVQTFRVEVKQKEAPKWKPLCLSGLSVGRGYGSHLCGARMAKIARKESIGWEWLANCDASQPQRKTIGKKAEWRDPSKRKGRKPDTVRGSRMNHLPIFIP